MHDVWIRHRWWIARVAALPLHLLGFSVLVFILVRAVPGDPILFMTDGHITPEQYAAAAQALGLDGGWVDQLSSFLGRVVRLEFGVSTVTGRSVWSELGQRAPASVELALLGLVGASIVAVGTSYVAVMHPRSHTARIARTYARAAGSIPEFVLGVALIFFFYAQLRWVPAPVGRLSPGMSMAPRITGMPLVDAVLAGDAATVRSLSAHLVLPLLVMSITYGAILGKLLIGGLEESVAAPATLFRISSGASRLTVIGSVYRRALPAAVTYLGALIGYLFGGTMVLETQFGFAGMGRYAIEAVSTKDIIALQGLLLFIGGACLVIYLLIDVANMLLDPRRRPGVRVGQ